MSVIITLETNISGGDTVFYERVKHKDLVKRAHVIKYVHGRIILGPFERCFHEGSIWRLHKALISFIITKQILCAFLPSWGSVL